LVEEGIEALSREKGRQREEKTSADYADYAEFLRGLLGKAVENR